MTVWGTEFSGNPEHPRSVGIFLLRNAAVSALAGSGSSGSIHAWSIRAVIWSATRSRLVPLCEPLRRAGIPFRLR